MKKSALFLVLGLFTASLWSCNKSDKEPEANIAGIYIGQTRAESHYQMYDPRIDSLITIDWDTTYLDNIKVEIDRTTQKIKFITIDTKASVGWYDFISEYAYTGESSYTTIYSVHGRQYFKLIAGDSLQGQMDSYSGTGRDFYQSNVRFSGKKVR